MHWAIKINYYKFMGACLAAFFILLFIIGFRTFMASSIKLGKIEEIPHIRKDVVNNLAGAIRFQTVSPQKSIDIPGTVNGKELLRFHNYLQKTFPLVHKSMKREIIAEYSLLYTWKGKDPLKKPIILMGHMDVASVETDTLQRWQVPPFAGVSKNGYIYGRGTLDDKISVIGLLSAAEALLKEGFQSTATIYFAFGHDEETGGNGRGAKTIAETLSQRKIRAEFILDEGSGILEGMIPGVMQPCAFIGIAERGAVTFQIRAIAEGGHSSIPPRQTAIGRIANAISKLESRQMTMRLDSSSRYLFEFSAPYSTFLFKLIYSNLWLFEPVLLRIMDSKPTARSAIRTSTAVTRIHGGDKDSNLPVEAWARINFRTLPGDSIDTVERHIRTVIDDPGLEVTMVKGGSNPPLVSDPYNSGFQLISDSIRSINPEIVPVPFTFTGRTDSRFYTSLSDSIYRFIPVQYSRDDLTGIHGLNERISEASFVEAVKFFYILISRL